MIKSQFVWTERKVEDYVDWKHLQWGGFKNWNSQEPRRQNIKDGLKS